MEANNIKFSWYKGRHLYVMLMSTLMFFLFVITNSGATNTIIPTLSGMNGWNESLVLMILTFGGYICAVALLFYGRLVAKVGPKKVMVIFLLLGGVFYALWGSSNSMVMFCVVMVAANLCGYGFMSISTPVLVSHWFPRSKGIVLGIATIGIILSDVSWSPAAPVLIGRIGPTPTFIAMGLVYIAAAIAIAFTIRNFPEEHGLYPDGTSEGYEDYKKTVKELESYRSPFTIRKSFATKQVWQITFGLLLLLMCGVMYVSRVVPRCLSLGYSPDFAISVLQVCGVFSIIGSFVFGLIDQRLGTKKACMIHATFYAIIWVITLFQGPGADAFVWIASIGVLFGLGGIYNLIISMTISIFGRWDFVGPNTAVAFMQAVLISSNYTISSVFVDSGLGFRGVDILSLILTAVALVVIFKTDTRCIGKTDEAKIANA